MDSTSFELDLNDQQFRNTRIYQSIQACDHQQCLEAIYAGEDVNLRDEQFRATYLHQVVIEADGTTEDNYLPLVYQLSNAGIDLDAMDYRGQTALELAITKTLLELMIALLRVGCNPQAIPYRQRIEDYGGPFEYELMYWFEKYEPGLWAAVMDNDIEKVALLIQSWCRTSITRNDTLLIDAARERGTSNDIIAMLENNDISNEFVHATLAGDEMRMLDLLQDPRCDPTTMDMSFQENWTKPVIPRSLRETAAIMGHLHILHLLPKSYYNADSFYEYADDTGIAMLEQNSTYPMLMDTSQPFPSPRKQTEITRRPCAICESCQDHTHDVDATVHFSPPLPRPVPAPRRRRNKKPKPNETSVINGYGNDFYKTNYESLKAAKAKSATCSIL